MYNHSNTTLLSESGLGAFNGHYWDSSELEKNPLDTVTVKLSSIIDDSPYYHPEYPNVLGSWDDSVKQTDEYGFKMNYDKMDKDFLGWVSKDNKKTNLDKKIEDKFGIIISKFPILHHEWEMDGYGYIVRDLEYNKNAIITNHGKPMVVNKSYLNDIISGYRERIQETQRALFLINE
jgi:hypothetical protein